MMRRRVFCGAVVAAAVALGAGGCGGDDGPTDGEFVKRADAVCHKHYVTISEAASKVLAGGKLPTPAQFGKLAQGTIIPEYSAQITELREVEPSASKKDAYDKWLSDSEALRAKVKANPALVQQAPMLAAINGQSDKLGLSTDCHLGAG